MRVCVCVCVYVCVGVGVSVDVVCVCVCERACVCVGGCACMCACVHICVCPAPVVAPKESYLPQIRSSQPAVLRMDLRTLRMSRTRVPRTPTISPKPRSTSDSLQSPDRVPESDTGSVDPVLA